MVLRLPNDGVKNKASAQYVKYVSRIRTAEYAGKRFAHSLQNDSTFNCANDEHISYLLGYQSIPIARIHAFGSNAQRTYRIKRTEVDVYATKP